MIPSRLQTYDFNFTLIHDGSKAPKGYGWQRKVIRYDNSQLTKHLNSGGNIGLQMNNSRVGEHYLIVVDFDKKSFQDLILPQLPESFTTSSGSPKKCVHVWFACDSNRSFKIHDEQSDTLCDVLGAGNQVLIQPSKHPSGSSYHVVKDLPFAFISYEALKELLLPYDKKPKKVFQKSEKQNPISVTHEKKPYDSKGSLIERAVSNVSMDDVLHECGVDTTHNPTACPFHPSVKGACLSWNDNLIHCFHCDGGWNKYSFLREAKRLDNKQAVSWFIDRAGLTKEYEQAKQEYLSQQQEPKGWACSISITRFAKRHGCESCSCGNPYVFNERLGWFKCDSCKVYGGLKGFARLIMSKREANL